MQYDPIKRSVGRIFSGSNFKRRILYNLLDILLLRAWHINKVLNKISGFIPDNALVLDAGCGFGQYIWRMGRKNRNWKIKGIDINKDHIEDCTNFFRNSVLMDRVSFELCDLTALTDKEKYHLILSVDVMEHISDDKRVFYNFHRALVKDGIVLISTPSDKGGSDVRCENDSSFIDEHVRNGYGREEIRQKLENAGFREVKTLYTYGKPGNISWHLSMKYPVKMLNNSKLFFAVLPIYYFLVLPVALILNIFDLIMIHKSGTGLLVTAKK